MTRRNWARWCRIIYPSTGGVFPTGNSYFSTKLQLQPKGQEQSSHLIVLRAPGLQMSVLKQRTEAAKETIQLLIWKWICSVSEVLQESVNSLTSCLEFLTAAVVQMLVWDLWLIFCPQIHVNQERKKKYSSSTALPAQLIVWMKHSQQKSAFVDFADVVQRSCCCHVRGKNVWCLC